MFVADFIGSPPMNFLHFEAGLQPGSRAIQFRDASVAVPEIRELRAVGPLVLACVPSTSCFPKPPRCGAAFSAPSIWARRRS